MKRINDTKAGTQNIKCFIVVVEGGLLSEDASSTHLTNHASHPWRSPGNRNWNPIRAQEPGLSAHRLESGNIPALVLKLLFHLSAAEIHLRGELEMRPTLRQHAEPQSVLICEGSPFRGDTRLRLSWACSVVHTHSSGTYNSPLPSWSSMLVVHGHQLSTTLPLGLVPSVVLA